MVSQTSSKNFKSKEKFYVSDYNKNYYQKKKQTILARQNEYYAKNKRKFIERQRSYKTRKYKTDPNYKLRSLISRAVAYAVSKNKQSITKYLPYSFEELRSHIESQFETWMSWENHGNYNSQTWNDDDTSTWTWQIDHITPQSDLPFSSMEEENFIKCWALNNLRPLSAKQNHADGVNRTRHFQGNTNG